LAATFIEPGYSTINGIDPGSIRASFGLDEFQAAAVATVTKAGGDIEKPNSPHLASIHHTQFLVAFDVAKDHSGSWQSRRVRTWLRV
jgi:hypothetical protein